MSPLSCDLFDPYAGWTAEQLQAEADRLAIEILLMETVPQRPLAKAFSRLTLWLKRMLHV